MVVVIGFFFLWKMINFEVVNLKIYIFIYCFRVNSVCFMLVSDGFVDCRLNVFI